MITDTISISDNTILIDSDGMPWRCYRGYFSSVWSRTYATQLADLVKSTMVEADFNILVERIREWGLTLDELISRGYGPWWIVTKTEQFVIPKSK